MSSFFWLISRLLGSALFFRSIWLHCTPLSTLKPDLVQELQGIQINLIFFCKRTCLVRGIWKLFYLKVEMGRTFLCDLGPLGCYLSRLRIRNLLCLRAENEILPFMRSLWALLNCCKPLVWEISPNRVFSVLPILLVFEEPYGFSQLMLTFVFLGHTYNSARSVHNLPSLGHVFFWLQVSRLLEGCQHWS